MKNDQRAQYVARDTILKLLSDTEVASVAMAETATSIREGDEYIDLTELQDGVRRSPAASAKIGHTLSRASVRQETWEKILGQLTAFREAPRS